MVSGAKTKKALPKSPLAVPSNGEIEELVIASVLLWPDTAEDLSRELTVDDFYSPHCRTIYKAILSLVRDAKSPDTILIADELTKTGKMEQAGGRLRLNDLIALCPSEQLVPGYVRIVREKSALRKLAFAGDQIAELGRGEGKGLAEVAEEAEAIIRSARIQAALASVGKIIPVIDAEGSTLSATWNPPGVKAIARRLQPHQSDGSITGLLSFSGTIPGAPESILSGQFNFASIPTRTTWQKRLEEKADLPGGLWGTILEQLCEEVRKFIECGNPPKIVTSEDEQTDVKHLLWPVILEGEPTIIYGDIGSNKSYLATLFTYMLVCGQTLPGLESRSRIACPLYLDWESSERSFGRRWARIKRGMGLPDASAWYRRCSFPLSQEADQIRETIKQNGHDFIVVDSLALASGGDLNSPEPAVNFYKALRSLNVTSLVIAHHAKNPTGKTSVFGSQFFSALPRSIWEVRRDQEEGEDITRVGLYHTKSNEGPREQPIGLRFIFGGDYTRVEPDDPKTVLAGLENAPLRDRIVAVIRQDGQATYQSLSETLREKEATIRQMMRRLKDEERVTQLPFKTKDGRLLFGLCTKDEER